MEKDNKVLDNLPAPTDEDKKNALLKDLEYIYNTGLVKPEEVMARREEWVKGTVVPSLWSLQRDAKDLDLSRLSKQAESELKDSQFIRFYDSPPWKMQVEKKLEGTSGKLESAADRECYDSSSDSEGFGESKEVENKKDKKPRKGPTPISAPFCIAWENYDKDAHLPWKQRQLDVKFYHGIEGTATFTVFAGNRIRGFKYGELCDKVSALYEMMVYCSKHYSLSQRKFLDKS